MILIVSFFIAYLTSIILNKRLENKFRSYNNDTIIFYILITINLLLTNNIFISSILIILLMALIKIVNFAKYKALNESLVFSDVALFSQVFIYPRLYLPFLNVKTVILAIPFLLTLIYIIVSKTLLIKITYNSSAIFFINLILIFFEFLYIKKIPLVSNIEQSIHHYGLLTHLIKGLQASYTQIKASNFTLILNQSSNLYQYQKKLPSPQNIIAVQSESFFNPEKLDITYNKKILENLKIINQQALQFGELYVPAWGANTMRSEFAFLSGIANKDLGQIRYYPYLFLSHKKIITLPNYLKQQGYFCICIHPYPAGFFRRDQVFKNLGFDLFIDIKDFQGADKIGAYISDQAVTTKIIEIIESFQDKPLFIFAITMENHGPLHLETVTSEEIQHYIKPNSLEKAHDLIAYLRHLENADNMIGNLTTYLSQAPTPSTLCFYGDHVPSMPHVYQALNYNNANTNYFIWNSQRENSINNQKDIDISALAKQLLDSL